MAAGSTYAPIATTTLGSAQASYTFTSIPQTYTDLICVVNASVTPNQEYLFAQVGNGSIDTGTNYSYTWIDSRVASSRSSNNTQLFAGPSIDASAPFVTILHFQNYSNTTTYKTILARGNSTTQWVSAAVSLWRSTSAINTIKILATGSDTLSSGSTLTLYGIAAA